MKLIASEKCPFCGCGIAGGGDHAVYYDCGAHVWIVKLGGIWQIQGHEGSCQEVLKFGGYLPMGLPEIVDPGGD